MKKHTRLGVFTALTTAMTTVFTLISIALPGGGYYNFGDVAIFIASIVLGPLSGMITGAIGACLGDVILGYFAYVPFTMIVKALEGLVAGLIAKAAAKFCNKLHGARHLESLFVALGNILGGLIMAGGYFLAEGLLLAEGKWSGGIINLPWNILQGTISALLSALLLYVLRLKPVLTKVYNGHNADSSQSEISSDENVSKNLNGSDKENLSDGANENNKNDDSDKNTL